MEGKKDSAKKKPLSRLRRGQSGARQRSGQPCSGEGKKIESQSEKERGGGAVSLAL